jgi:ATP-binding cassette subfamily B protein
MGDTVARMQRSLAAAERIFRLLDQRPTIPSGTRRLPREEVSGAIRFEEVEFSYGGPQVLRKISLEIPAGKTTAIVGGTGAGKSTLLKLLLRLYEFQGGRIELDGIDIRELRTQDLRRAIALVSQEVFLFHGTVRENISYGRPDASQAEIEEAARLAAADGFIAALPKGYDTIVGERGAMLSGGQRQRISIARALLTRAPILALDEATSSVDNETEEVIQRSLMEAAKGMTRIVIAHRLSTIRHADHIYVLHNGAVVEEGRHDELIALGRIYANLWRVQTGERKEH